MMKRSKRKKSIRVFLLALLLLAVCAAAFFAYRRRGGVNVTPMTEIEGFWGEEELQAYSFLQNDEAWSGDALGTSRHTMGSSGCLTTCLTSVLLLQEIPVAELQNAPFTPGRVNEFFGDHDVYDTEGNIQWDMLESALQQSIIRKSAGEINAQEISALLQDGIYPIVQVHMPVSTSTHFVVLVGAKEDTFICMDPLYRQGIRELKHFGNRIYAVRYVDTNNKVMQ